MKTNLDMESTQETELVSYKEILKFYGPILINTGVLVLIPPIINYGLSWSSNPQMAYAIFASSFSIQVFLNGLILTQKKVTLSIGKNLESFKAVQKFYLLLSLLICILFLLFGNPSLGFDFFKQFFNLPESIAFQSSELIFLLSPTPFILSLRTSLQSLALLHKKSDIVSFGTFTRIIISFATIVAVIKYSRFSVASSIAITYLVSYGIETLLLLLIINKYKDPPQQQDKSLPTFSQIFSFSVPLCLSSLSWSLLFPIINFFIGKIDGNGIATFGVIRPLILFYGGPIMSISSLLLIFHHNARVRKKIFTFCFSISMIVSALIGIFIKTGIVNIFLKGFYKFPESLIQESMGSSVYFILFPMVFFLKYYFEGKCLLNKNSNVIGIISFISIGFLLMAGFFSLSYTHINSGVNLGVRLMFFTIFVEGIFLLIFFSFEKKMRCAYSVEFLNWIIL